MQEAGLQQSSDYNERGYLSLNKIVLRTDLYYLAENLRTLFGPALVYSTQDPYQTPVYQYQQPSQKKDLGIKCLVEFLSPVLSFDILKVRADCGSIWFEIKDLQCFKLLSWEEKSIICVGLYLSRLSKSGANFFDRVNSTERISNPDSQSVIEFIKIGQRAELEMLLNDRYLGNKDQAIDVDPGFNIKDFPGVREQFAEHVVENLQKVFAETKQYLKNTDRFSSELATNALTFLSELEGVMDDLRGVINGKSSLVFSSTDHSRHSENTKKNFVEASLSHVINNESLYKLFRQLALEYFSKDVNGKQFFYHFIEEFNRIGVVVSKDGTPGGEINDDAQAYWYPKILGVLVDFYGPVKL